jgi:hypothetical protein
MFFPALVAASALLGLWPPRVLAQVSPAEIKNPGLKKLEQTYLPDLVALNQSISGMKFPFGLSLDRHVGLDPKDQVGADTRGLEFVIFHERELLKLSANYNAAFRSDTLTANQRANRVLGEVIRPVLGLLPHHFSTDAPFDGFGFEIAYHVLTRNRGYAYEGKEILVAVFDKSDGLRFAGLTDEAAEQEILNRSDIYLNGDPFGLALNSRAPLDIEALVRRPAQKHSDSRRSESAQPDSAPAGPIVAPGAGVSPNLEALTKKYQSELDSLSREGSKLHFVDYAPPSFILVGGEAALEATLRNPEGFDRDSTSIYRRAARAFDLFLARELRSILAKVPETPDFTVLACSVVNELTSAKSDKSSEAIEFVLPLKEARQFAAAEITSQDLINRSMVLVNGVRIALNLASAE